MQEHFLEKVGNNVNNKKILFKLIMMDFCNFLLLLIEECTIVTNKMK